MEPIVSDGRMRLRLWKTMTSRLTPEACMARLKESTISLFTPWKEGEIGALVGKNWALIWKRVGRRKWPVRALLINLDQKGMGASIRCMTAVSPFVAALFLGLLIILADARSQRDLVPPAIMSVGFLLLVAFGLLFSKSEGETLLTFVRTKLETREAT